MYKFYRYLDKKKKKNFYLKYLCLRRSFVKRVWKLFSIQNKKPIVLETCKVVCLAFDFCFNSRPLYVLNTSWPCDFFLSVFRAKLELGEITHHNIKQLKRLNTVVFPVSYNEKFYKDVLEAGELAKLGAYMVFFLYNSHDCYIKIFVWFCLAYYNDIVVGAVCCRVDQEVGRRLYIMTLGCLSQYRRLGIGSMMVEHVLNFVENDGTFDSVYL